MGYFAKLDANSIVETVISISNDILGEPTLTFPDTDGAGRAFIANVLKETGHWRQTSYNGNFRGVYAGQGFTYDENRDAFIPPQPYASWALDEDTCQWVAPIAYPAEGVHVWDEQAGDWVEVTDEIV